MPAQHVNSGRAVCSVCVAGEGKCRVYPENVCLESHVFASRNIQGLFGPGTWCSAVCINLTMVNNGSFNTSEEYLLAGQPPRAGTLTWVSLLHHDDVSLPGVEWYVTWAAAPMSAFVVVSK